MNNVQLKTNMETYEQICEFVLLERRNQKLSQKSLAEKSGVHKNTIGNLERKENVHIDSLISTLKGLGYYLKIEKINN